MAGVHLSATSVPSFALLILNYPISSHQSPPKSPEDSRQIKPDQTKSRKKNSSPRTRITPPSGTQSGPHPPCAAFYSAALKLLQNEPATNPARFTRYDGGLFFHAYRTAS